MSRKTRKQRPTLVEKLEDSFIPAKPLAPLNQTQAEYIHALKNNPIVIATGFAGTSKTYCATRVASLLLKQGAIDKIIYARPAVSASQSLGFFAGSAEEKMKYWVRPIMSTLALDFKMGQIEYMMKPQVNKLEGIPLETIKGSSFDNAFVIVDEASDLTLKEIKSILTRIGKNCTIVLAGDIAQSDLAVSGLGEFLKLLETSKLLRNAVTHIDFNLPTDIVRSDTCRDIILGFEEAA